MIGVSLRSLLSHKLRLALTTIAVILGSSGAFNSVASETVYFTGNSTIYMNVGQVQSVASTCDLYVFGLNV